MKEEQVREIIEILPKGRTLFYYFKDRYALELLTWYVGRGRKVSEIKRSPFAGLLQKPIVKEITANLPGQMITPQSLQSAWPGSHEMYLLTLGSWGNQSRWWSRYYHQTSRKGVNLVLQLNFSHKHNQRYDKLIKATDQHPFAFYSHPIHEVRHTLAWARIDLDWQAGEALIEEIQTDWIRRALSRKKRMEQIHRHRQLGGITELYIDENGCSATDIFRYVEQDLQPHVKTWDEAVLWAALWFIREELGIQRIFYHTFASGNNWKGFSKSHPPRSLYTTLPKKFCFRQTSRRPAFLPHRLAKQGKHKYPPAGCDFFVLEL